ncbi:ATP-binding protein [Litoreibacter halocynthiae]|uniref:ATP-binding protein n=1 Tax=Litoreibacter halocynthiae TaxID=1242689 RepID=UPI002492FCD4|nr:ATP-binding protein [Litoreibacter halocynthiae]
MKRTRFDTRLIQILSAMAVLAIMVGVAAIGVNRYLVRSHGDLIQSNLPAMELASRVGASAELVGSLAATFVQADTKDGLERISGALKAAVERIETGARELRNMSPAVQTTQQEGQAGQIIARMTDNAHEELRLAQRIAEESRDIARVGGRLDALIEAETDLARLRITAGIANIYSEPDISPRPALDRLADQYFFAFERLTELARITEAGRLQLQQVPRLFAPEELENLQTLLAERLVLAGRRISYMPSLTARTEAEELLQRFRQALAPEGMIELQEKRAALHAAIAVDSEQLTDVISVISVQAREARDIVQTQGLEKIATAQRRASLMTMGLLAIVAAAVIAGAILWQYARRQLVARLGNLSRRIVAVAEGTYGKPLSITGYDEIGRMEKALNILRRRAIDATRLQTHLEDAVIARTGDVVAEMKAVDAARAEAEAADRSKTEFLARMSHEIRTPLNGIIGMLSLLESEAVDDDHRERVKTAHKSARDLVDITNDILDYASSEDRANRGNPVHFPLRELVGQLGQQLQSLASDKNLEVVIDLAEDAPLVLFGDVVKLRQIVGNLISNAVKYTKRGTVTLSVDHAMSPETGQPVVSFAVSDTGVGMTRETIDHAFDAYARTEEARRSGIEGLGLGLAISRKLTEALGGALSVESELGVGSRFTLTVPLERGDLASIADDDAPMPTGDFGRDVLVIDDHAVNRIVARGYLERLGCTVSLAATGKAGIEAASAGSFDLILIDLDLPDMSGEQVAASIREMSGRALLVALTAHLIDDTKENRDRLGVAHILSKPISPRALTEVLSASASGEAPYNADAVLDSIRGDVSDLGQETTELILREFLADLPAAMKSIRSGPAEQQRKAAHRLKGAASNFQLHRFCADLAKVETVEQGADDELLRQVDSSADEAAVMLRVAAGQAGLQVDAGSTK